MNKRYKKELTEKTEVPYNHFGIDVFYIFATTEQVNLKDCRLGYIVR